MFHVKHYKSSAIQQDMETVIIGKHQLVFCQLTQLPRGLNFCLQPVPPSHPFPFSSLLLRDKSLFPNDHRVLVVFVAAAVVISNISGHKLFPMQMSQLSSIQMPWEHLMVYFVYLDIP